MARRPTPRTSQLSKKPTGSGRLPPHDKPHTGYRETVRASRRVLRCQRLGSRQRARTLALPTPARLASFMGAEALRT